MKQSFGYHGRRTLGALALAALGVAGCRNTPVATGAPAGALRGLPVTLSTVQLQPVPQYSEYVATLQSRTATVLQPQVEGEITAIFVHSGQPVAKGAPILQIDPLRQQATVQSAESSHQAAEATLAYDLRELQRRKALFAAGVTSRQDLDQAQSAYDAAAANLAALQANTHVQQAQLHYFRVQAPAAGIVGDVPVHVGDRVTTGTVLTTLDAGTDIEVYIYVSADRAAAVRLGLPVEVKSDEDATWTQTRVSFIAPRVDPATQLLLVKAPVYSGGGHFKNGQRVQARIIWSQQQLPLVPVTAVLHVGDKTFVYVAEPTQGHLAAQMRSIVVGELLGNSYPVTQGLHPGERVIISGTQMLADGAPVAPLP